MVETAMPAQVWVWMMQFTSGLAIWMALWYHKAGAVDAILEVAEVGLGEDVALMVDLDQARGSDLLVEQPVGV